MSKYLHVREFFQEDSFKKRIGEEAPEPLQVFSPLSLSPLVLYDGEAPLISSDQVSAATNSNGSKFV